MFVNIYKIFILSIYIDLDEHVQPTTPTRTKPRDVTSSSNGHFSNVSGRAHFWDSGTSNGNKIRVELAEQTNELDIDALDANVATTEVGDIFTDIQSYMVVDADDNTSVLSDEKRDNTQLGAMPSAIDDACTEEPSVVIHTMTKIHPTREQTIDIILRSNGCTYSKTDIDEMNDVKITDLYCGVIRKHIRQNLQNNNDSLIIKNIGDGEHVLYSMFWMNSITKTYL